MPIYHHVLHPCKSEIMGQLESFSAQTCTIRPHVLYTRQLCSRRTTACTLLYHFFLSLQAHWYDILPFAASSGQKTVFGYGSTPEVQQNKLTQPISWNKVFYWKTSFVRRWQYHWGQLHLGNLNSVPSEICSVTLNKLIVYALLCCLKIFAGLLKGKFAKSSITVVLRITKMDRH